MSDVPLGKLIEGEAERDAIHVAIAPVIAGERLSPGQHVGFVGDGSQEVVSKAAQLIGIVDPYLTGSIDKNERFYLCLYPQTVTGMKHHWQHPAFEPVAEVTPVVDRKAESEAWLRNFVDSASCPDYDTVIAAAAELPLPEDEDYGAAYSRWEDYLHFRGRSACGEIPPEFWGHVENVTGVRIPEHKRASHFSCSC